MTREQKYPNTDTFTFFNRNPHNRFTTDCVIRAISTALDIPYNTVVMEMAELQCETGFDMSENTLIDKYLKSNGWSKKKQPRKGDGTKYTGEEFCRRQIDKSRRVVANLGGHHVVAIVDWKVLDTWDSTSGCIGNYWTKD